MIEIKGNNNIAKVFTDVMDDVSKEQIIATKNASAAYKQSPLISLFMNKELLLVFCLSFL